MHYVKGDPYWITARYPGRCMNPKCQGHIPTGSRAFYWPKGRMLECRKCGEASERKFLAECQDEIMSGGWS